jgi:acetoacetyl-CoA synthetase
MKEPLWKPSKEIIEKANMTRYMQFVNQTHGLRLNTYQGLYEWSINDIPNFWATVWDFVGIKASKDYEVVVEDLGKFPGTKWFPGARLNFAENLKV